MEADIFDMTGIELVKKKYYNAAKVNDFVAGIKAAHDALALENAGLKAQLEALSSQKAQIGDTLMSAQSIARQMIDDARTQAEETARLAQAQAEETVKAAEKRQSLSSPAQRARKMPPTLM